MANAAFPTSAIFHQKAMANAAFPTSATFYQGCTSAERSPEVGCRGCENDGSGIWTFEENKRFKNALATLSGEIDLSTLCDFVEVIAPEFPGKSAEQVGRHLEALWQDVHLIESGQVMFPEHWTVEEGDSDGGPLPVQKSKGKSKVEPKRERKRGIAWTKEEHERFLGGLQIYGKGDWKSISKYVVMSKTPTQVASHAQKYFNRKDRTENQKLRRSINDTHNISNIGAIASMSSSPPSTRYPGRN
ncbi:transcription factor SRM1-like [Eucalyptus grandis]|uniref:transcription factor SRM1-like n=1 Tax=Eucalyptus grandis TaxID=71139 RepID=UPI00192E97BE|nr:transcription factor SRM1-like [Eucalyptus grandis]